MDKRKAEKYPNLSTVEKRNNNLIPEEFPEGSYGSPVGVNTPVEGKDWSEEQHRTSAYTYENRLLHDDLPRQTDGAHPTHDDPDK